MLRSYSWLRLWVCAEKHLLRFRKGARNFARPRTLPFPVSYEILAYLDLNIGYAAQLSMKGNCVIHSIAARVRLVIANYETRLPTQFLKHEACEATITIVEHCRVHRSAHRLEDIGHAVLGDQNASTPRPLALIEQSSQMIMIRLENLRAASGYFLWVQPYISRNRD